MKNKYEQINLAELTRLKDFHFSEYTRFKGLIEKSQVKIKTKSYGRKDKTIAEQKAKKQKECDFVFNILKTENRELGTGELCALLNESLESTRTYNSMTFMGILGKHLITADERFLTRVGKTVEGKRSHFWKINE